MTLLREDLRWSMPPDPVAVAGRDEAINSWVVEGGFGSAALGEFRSKITGANGMPAVANYLRKNISTGTEPPPSPALRDASATLGEKESWSGPTWDEAIPPVRMALQRPAYGVVAGHEPGLCRTWCVLHGALRMSADAG